MSFVSQELVNIIESLRAKLLTERRKNLMQEMEIRQEMGDAMMKQIMESEELRRYECDLILSQHHQLEQNVLTNCSV